MKNITIAGRLTRDATLRRTQDGDAVLSFSVAVDDRSKKEKSIEFFDCSLWGKRGQAIEQYLTKATVVVVSGDLGKREHEGKTYLTIRANDVTLLGGNQRQDEGEPRQNDTKAKASNYAKASTGFDDDGEIPF